MPRTIDSQDDIEEGLAWLCQREPRFVIARELSGQLPLRRREEGFSHLLNAIVSQQLSVAAARTIWGRVNEAGFVTPTAILNANEDTMRALGLSRQKITYARSLAEANIDFNALRDMESEDVIKHLIVVKGIGVWTAEIYAMFSLGHADVFAHEDLALQEATRSLFELDERPRGKVMRALAEQWQPWRAVAARLLWAYYGQIKGRTGINA